MSMLALHDKERISSQSWIFVGNGNIGKLPGRASNHRTFWLTESFHVSCFAADGFGKDFRTLVIHDKADLDGHLPMMHFSLFDVATRFDQLKPAQILYGFVHVLSFR